MLIVGMLLLVALSITIIVFLHDAHTEFPDRITVEAEGVTEKILNVRDLKLMPTEKKEYSVSFFCAASGRYSFDVEYVEKKDGGLKDHVIVDVLLDDKAVYSGPLSELLDEDVTINFEGTLEDEVPLTVSFIYEMPRHVGNEAQGTWSDFDIKFAVKKS